MSKEISQGDLQQIVERAQEGSLADFQRLYDLYAKAIYNFIWRLIGSTPDAEDLTQDTFLKVHKELKRLRDPAQFKFWLYRIARNEVYQKLRRAKKVPEISMETGDVCFYDFIGDDSPGLDPERQVLSGELHTVIQQSLASMPAKYRDVFVLAVFQKESYENITRIVGRSLLSVKTDIYRARLIVKESLNNYLKRSQ
jgi:RNA polymerase sigma-70 factor (ECF subfamily)